ncbi:MAG: SpoVR family protein [Zetaproteobacteria bacterium]|nr:SpoVR family protein [Pseudobdellovibrionaceae bacterium]
MFHSTDMPQEIQETIDLTQKQVEKLGLDIYTTIFELVDYKQLNEIAACGGFPTRYPHWRWGMEYERLSKSYTYGLSVIYEMVINNDPCYAYLLRSNGLTTQKTVIAHVYAHCDFFKNNYWFSQTNRKMLDQMANHATIVRHLIDELGYDRVESFIDKCLSVENLIDLHLPFRPKRDRQEKENKEFNKVKNDSKSYMESFIKERKKAAELEKNKQKEQDEPKILFEPEQDVLKYILDYGHLENWEYALLSIIRDEAYYFAPQGQTKILNEGWATYWHSRIMTEITPLKSSEIIDYCDQYSSIVASNSNQLNPYKLGLELLRYVEHRWDTGKYGLEYLKCEDHKEKFNWNKAVGKGQEKLFEVRKYHNDITFLDEFLDEEFCHMFKLFLYDFDPRQGKQVIANRNFKDIKKQLLTQLANFGSPIIKVVDGNFRNRGELLLKHYHERMDLKSDYALETLSNLYSLWKRPVHLHTVVENIPRQLSFDGSNHSIEKI